MPRIRYLPVPPGLGDRHALTVSRLRYRPGAGYDRHRHGFCEVFWIEDGRCRHLVGDIEQECTAGTLVVIRPEDVHGFATYPGESFTLVNVTFTAAVPGELARRWRRHLADWPWGDAREPYRLQLDGHGLARLGDWATELMVDGSRLALEAFLLDLLRLGGRSAQTAQATAPPWLGAALREFADPARLGAGLPGFVRCCGRSVAHVNRVVRSHHGCTATALVGRLRLDHACRQLRMSDTPIPAIAAACGYASLAHFYRAFARLQRTTPRRYRASHRSQVTGHWG